MTNREKYHFDDFTLDNYRCLIELALSKGYQFISYTDDFAEERKDILWRHDVEFEPDIALKMAEIERKAEVTASYFFQIHSPYYNLFDGHYTKVFHQIKDLGHHTGLHFDCRYWHINEEKQLNDYIHFDADYLEKVFGVKLEMFSFHNTTPFTQSCLEYKYGGLINVYSSHFKKNFYYCSDSLGYWRFDRLEDVLNNDTIHHLQVLTHDANWSEDVLSPRKRFMKAVRNNAERRINGQINGIHAKGNLMPDDEED
jgi:hypothetical protein